MIEDGNGVSRGMGDSAGSNSDGSSSAIPVSGVPGYDQSQEQLAGASGCGYDQKPAQQGWVQAGAGAQGQTGVQPASGQPSLPYTRLSDVAPAHAAPSGQGSPAAHAASAGHDAPAGYGAPAGQGAQTGYGAPAGQSATMGQGAAMEQNAPVTAFDASSRDCAGADQAGSKPKHKGARSFVWGIVGVVAGAAIVFGALFATGSLGGGNAYSGQSNNGTINITASSEATTAQAVAAKVLPSIVSIDVYTQQSASGYGLFGSNTGQTTETQSSLGSGVIISQDGYILTNYHVISEGSKYIVHFDDDSTAEATVVGSDDSSDLAVLKVDKTGLTPIEVADSSEVVVGDWVMTAGSPFGLTKSVSEGIVSALYRNETLQNSYGQSFYANMIQVDAGINPGNSGGALVDSEGKLIGICVMTASYSGDFSGVGFAIPSNYAMNVANSIMTTGQAEHPYLGVSVATVDASTSGRLNTSADSGAYVASVISGGPADKAGVQEGDVITSMDGKAVTTSSELIINIRSKEIGDTVELGIVRNGQEITLSATLASDAQNLDRES